MTQAVSKCIRCVNVFVCGVVSMGRGADWPRNHFIAFLTIGSEYIFLLNKVH